MVSFDTNQPISGANATREQLKMMFGEPDDISATTKKRKWPTVFKYGLTEYWFDNSGKVCEIYAEDEQGDNGRTIWKR